MQRDPILSEEQRLIVVTTINSNPAGGRPDTVCLPDDMPQGYLFGISTNRVKVEVREQVIRYQRECYRVLSDYFRGQQARSQHETSSAMTLAEVYSLGFALVRPVEEHIQP